MYLRILSILLFATSFSKAQTYFISGTVSNKTTKETLPFVSVTLKNNTKTFGAITNEEGFFVIENLRKGNYTLEISSLGFEIHTQKINLTKNLNLENIVLQESSEALEEVYIRAETSNVIQKIDRKVINVGKDLTSIGNDAAGVLNNIQSVTVDAQDGSLSLRGNENVKVLVDGKPTQIPTDQLLKQIPSNAIKNIELITNPSAKYNPEGNSGIINIVLVKNTKKGLNGTLSNTLQYGKNFRYNGGVNLNYKTGKINVYGNYNISTGTKEVDGKIDRSSPTIFQRIDSGEDYMNHLFKIGADIDFTPKNTLSFFTTQSFVDFDYLSLTNIQAAIETNLTSNNSFQFNRIPINSSYDLAFHHEFEDKKHSIDIEVLYGEGSKDENSNWQDSLNPNDLTRNYTEAIDENKNNLLINVDYSVPFSNDNYLEIGLELRTDTTENQNDSTQDVIINNNGATDTRGLSEFHYDRDIYSAYFNYKHQLGKIGIQTGLRIEDFNVSGNFKTSVDNQNEPVTDNNFNYYPSLFLTYDYSEENQFQFSYSRRVDRPSIKQVTPIRTWGTPLVTSKGNPNLKQQFTNSFEFSYNRKIKGGYLNSTLFFRNIHDFISRIQTKDALIENRVLLSYDNFDTTNNFGVEISSYLKILSWWKLNASTDFYSQKQQGIVNNLNKEITNNQFNFRWNNSFQASKNLKFQLSGLYRGKSKSLQINRKAMYMINLGSSLNVLKDQGTVTLGLSDIFNTFRFRFNATEPFVQQGQFRWESRVLSLGFVYNFGKKLTPPKKRKRKKEKEVGSGGIF